MPAIEQELDRLTPGFAVAACPVIDVHSNETIRAHRVRLQLAGVTSGIGECLLAVIECVIDALGQQAAQSSLDILRQIAPNSIGTKR